MPVTVTTHLNFRGDARAALAFYRAAFGGHVAIVTYQDAANVTATSEANQVMWGQLAADNGLRLMAYDVPAHTPYHPGENAFFIALESQAADDIRAHWASLSDGATNAQALAPSPWSPLYGMLKDRFGVTWVLSVVAPYNRA